MHRTKRLFCLSLSKAVDCLRACWSPLRAAFLPKPGASASERAPFLPSLPECPPLEKAPLLHHRGLGTGACSWTPAGLHPALASSASSAQLWAEDAWSLAAHISLQSCVCQPHCSPSPAQVSAGKRQWMSKREMEWRCRIRTNRGQEARVATRTIKLQDKALSHLPPVALALMLLAWASVTPWHAAVCYSPISQIQHNTWRQQPFSPYLEEHKA